MTTGTAEADFARLKDVIARHWGFSDLRPMQEAAMRAVLAGRDSLVVLPTGGGKSLCFQGPAAARDGVTVVVSPLIALMKDQVDNLRSVEVAADYLASSQSGDEQWGVRLDLEQGNLKLLFVSPERIMVPGFQDLLRRVGVHTIAVDEAHCISQWGHDFRPEYRQMHQLRDLFPGAALHAYTATATERVRDDIVRQLGLRDPEVLVGDFDRPNLVYRVQPRDNPKRQVRDAVAKRPNEAAIVYCIRRKDVDEMAESLNKAGHNALPYHAGLDPDERKRTQEAFRTGECDLVVATVAFGMGIDRPNVRLVIHTGMPKSIEHYQQEAGRAGRDGLEAECLLLYSPQDYFTLKQMIERSAEEGEADPDYAPRALRHLDGMMSYGRSPVCRHRTLVEHFGQSYGPANCQACDMCLGEVELEPDSLTIAQKILSCVARVKQRFGVEHVVSVLRGDNSERVRSLKHDELSTHGLLRDHARPEVRDWIYQLVYQGLLVQTADEYRKLQLNEASWEVMRSERDARLLRTVKRKQGRESRAAREDWAGVDRDLFERLRAVRKELAGERQVPAYRIFSDATLREMCRVSPQSIEEMGRVTGVGEAKLRDFGEVFVAEVQAHCRG